jgi:hypothetical protein
MTFYCDALFWFQHVQRLRKRERVHGGGVQDLRGTPQADQPQHPQHHLRHRPTVRLHRSGKRKSFQKLMIIENYCIKGLGLKKELA